MLTKTTYTVDFNLLDKAVSLSKDVEFKETLNAPTGNFFYEPWTIKNEYKGTVWETILNTLPNGIGEARVIVLKQGTCYQSHGDIDDRYHINLKGEYSYIINLDTTKMFELIKDGYWYEMNAGPRHSAANFGNTDRIQLVVRKLLQKNTLKDPVKIKMFYSGTNKYGVRFAFDDVISPWLNTANKQNYITDFRFDHNDVRFDIERTMLNELIDLLPKDFKIEQL